MKPVVFVASMARSGSMWTYNVSRELLSASGMTVLPEKIPQDANTILEQLSDPDPGPGAI